MGFNIAAGIKQISDTNDDGSLGCKDPDPQTKEIFLPFRCFCSRKDVRHVTSTFASYFSSFLSICYLLLLNFS